MKMGQMQFLMISFFAMLLGACSTDSDSVGGHQGHQVNEGQIDANPRYEVWFVDQSDTRDQNHGGTVYIHAGAALSSSDPLNSVAIAQIDLAAATASLCRESTGANPVRPHMLLFNEHNTHAILSFVASGHVVLFDAATREPVACFRSTQSPTGQQAHAAFPAPDGSYILVANQSGKRLERIDTDFAANSFTYNTDATLDLATCITPSGAACEDPELRPVNWPICPITDSSGDLAFVTLRGGGLLVVDPRQTPMAILAEYDRTTVKGNGCGGIEAAGHIYLNSGGSPVNVSGTDMAHPHLFGFDVYRFPLEGYSAGNPANTPAPEVIFSKSGAADSHGMVGSADGSHLWVFDRHENVAEIIATASGQRIATIALSGAISSDPAPDLVDIAPDGQRLFVAFRGPTPLSGDPHNATGSTPGLAIIDLHASGAHGELVGVIPASNIGADGVQRADIHAVRVRRM